MSPLPEFYNFSVDVMERWARENGNGTALWIVDETGQSERKLTFSELSAKLQSAGRLFRSLGIDKGDRVLLILPRVEEWWIAILGLLRIGAVPIPGTPLLTPRDIAYRIEAAEVKAVITDAAGAVKFGTSGLSIKIVVGGAVEGWTTFDLRNAPSGPPLPPQPTHRDDPSIIYFTSGTTGHPKMVLHNHVTYPLGHEVTGRLWLDLHPGDVLWTLSDTGWAKAAWSCLFGPWQCGATLFVVDIRGKFDAAATVSILSKFPINVWCAPATALRLIVREELSRFKFPHLRHCVSAGEPVNPEIISAWKAATGLTIYEGFGQSESVILVGNFRSLGLPVRPGSMGVATPGYELAILDADLNPVADGMEGDLAVRVKPNRPLGIFLEYWKNPTENAARFRGDYYLTGDVATRDSEGYYWFVGRADDVIKSSGYRIGPFEVESALVEHPAVLESAVVGKPDDARGALVKAFVVLRKGVEGSEQLVKDLQEHCKKVTAPYKYPREIEFVTELPKTPSGKIRRVELRNR